jgi:hypothetical protein
MQHPFARKVYIFMGMEAPEEGAAPSSGIGKLRL